MAVHRRRRTSASALRVALILGANVVGAWFLWGLIHPTAKAARPDSAPAASALSPASAAKLARPGVADTARGPAKIPTGASQARLDQLGARIRPIVERYKRKAETLSKGHVDAGSTRVAVHVRDPASGAEFGIEASRMLRPASNMKLVTTVTALTLLGSDWAFVTPIEARGTLQAGRLEGDLVLRACGDPLFDMDGGGSVRALLAPALDELARSGLSSVSGNLVLDEGSFDKPAPPPGWPGPEQRSSEYCSLSGGFSANRGCLTVRVTPTSTGSAAEIDVEPAGYGLERHFNSMTVVSGQTKLGIDARPTGLIVRGTIPKSSRPFVDSCPVPDPVNLFGEVLLHELAARKIHIEGQLVRERRSAAGRVLARIRTPLVHYLAPIHQESNNAVADQVYLGTANAFLGSAKREGAQAAALAAMERLHVTEAGFRQVDGSGLSDLNRVSARQLTAMLQAVTQGDALTAQLFRASLAVAGVSGTLDDRMRHSSAKGRVFAKTGFIGGTSALSGIALCKGDGELIFSIVVNYEEFGGLNTTVWKPMEDEICELLVGVDP